MTIIGNDYAYVDSDDDDDNYDNDDSVDDYGGTLVMILMIEYLEKNYDSKYIPDFNMFAGLTEKVLKTKSIKNKI